MARPIVLSNGELHVGINKYGLVHDFYYPYVGLENHVAGKSLRHKVGVWIDGQLSWLDEDSGWEFTFRYPSTALIGHTIAKNERIGVLLEFDDLVDTDINAFLRNIHIVNLWEHEREIRLFTHQVFAIGDSRSNTDTAQYLPNDHAVLHYRGRRAFVISGFVDGSKEGFDQYTVGLFGIEGREGSHRDADDGELSFSNVEHGRVDSVLRFKLVIAGHSSSRVHYWIAAGTSMREALGYHEQIKKEGLLKRLHHSAEWWRVWLKPTLQTAEKVDPEFRESFIRSAMIIKSQIDSRGAVIASTDTTMLNYARDAYGYSWPRDGAYVLWPLIRMGYREEAEKFFDFCRRGLHPDGYLMHKYRADGGLGSSWHPYLHDGEFARPIQEDESALVLFVFAQYYHLHTDPRILDEYYDSLVVPMANFMSSFIDESTGLPQPSYDLWEEVLLTSTYTTATVYASLQAAVDLAEIKHDEQNAVKWKTAADQIYDAAHTHLFNTERGAFFKGVITKQGELHKDQTIDASSFFGAFIFGLFPSGSPELEQAYHSVVDVLGGGGIGIPRYENDNYQRVQDTPPNWWFISSLWIAQYHIEHDRNDEAKKILQWVLDHASSTGVLSEQINPITEQRVSVEPLTWSHAEYLSTLLDMSSGKSKE